MYYKKEKQKNKDIARRFRLLKLFKFSRNFLNIYFKIFINLLIIINTYKKFFKKMLMFNNFKKTLKRYIKENIALIYSLKLTKANLKKLNFIKKLKSFAINCLILLLINQILLQLI